MLDRLFSAFDDLAAELRLEKIKTIGDAYMVVGGVPEPRADHVGGGRGHGARDAGGRPPG